MKRREFLRLVFSSLVLVIGPFSRVSSKENKKWAMAIDVERCIRNRGCRDCIKACHEAHNVPKMPDAKHEIKWIWLDSIDHVIGEAPIEELKGMEIPCLCNHCENPACVKVCPTKATWKREDGIVMMDYHRCIGCRYCMAACPYGARSFNFLDPEPHIKKINSEFPRRTKGVVEKCNFCEERLSRGLLPFCVNACKEKAIIFGNLNDPFSEIRTFLKSKVTLSRKAHLGTRPNVFYVFKGV